jgi:hypothetical protein
LIRVHGAHENNLKDVSIEIPKGLLTVVTGVSGSSTPASRSSSSRTTSRSWRTPTGSSTLAPAPAMTAAGSSSRTPAGLVEARSTLTGEHLAAYIGA